MALASGMIVLVSAVMIGIDIVARLALGRELIDSFELTSFGLAVMFAFGLPYSFISGAHIRIDAIEKLRHPVFRVIAGLSAYGSMAVFAVVLAYYGLDTVLDSVRSGARSNSTLALPVAIPQALWVFGLILFAAVAVFALVRAASWLASRRNVDLLQLSRPERDAEPAKLSGLEP